MGITLPGRQLRDEVMNQLKNVWLWVDGVKMGPYAASTVAERVARGEVHSAYFQFEGTDEWKPLAEWKHHHRQL